ncbi:hypothetical protein [Prochlorococcus marinus]|uniref:Uncharacterized protein n=1 Tax=Prochlorococcus marinus XMU1408 TaxID=2213228 RepID=A0A318R282_PROMR|nr:hypothetical protein [Prochlorococcus marinus]PYE01081.1 hypothetical protein DNJ73_06510 [Prochlorococcus marinus XMU1408]
MDKKRSQLNIQIDPELLIELKTEAIKNGKTLSGFVTELLEQSPNKGSEEILEQRLLRVEKEIKLIKNISLERAVQDNTPKTIFSDSGAKIYGEVAKELFEFYRKEKKLTLKAAFAELSRCLENYDSQPELVFNLLSGDHELSGKEMTDAYRNGSCGMRSALSDWTQSSLEPLNEAFLNAVEPKNLV